MKPLLEPDLDRCLACAHHERTAVFDLCRHADSAYSIAGKADVHTIGHMRTIGGCGTDAKKFKSK